MGVQGCLGGLRVGFRRLVFVDGLKNKEGRGGRLLLTARVERVEGRKVFVSQGEVCKTAEAVFIKNKKAAL